ncbi:hemagglutinin repeat-containing protein [Stenotrophomonas maltophilia]|uniref:hemagglutinin repeat-containing protein n=3 Tax=Stenotrophomonas maltophilia TaxID=40324 RepID=UPI003CCFE64C
MGSTIRSQGDVSIVATAGDLSIIGSQVKGNNVALAARDNITLRSEAEDHTQSSKNKSGSGEIGFSIGAQTGWYVSASTAKGKGSGNGTTHVETVVDADRNLTVISGKDTTLQGAQLSGDKVVASIGGNLSIISEQDTDDYASKQTQAGGTFVYGSGGSVNIGQQKVESHLRSVQEQSGIVAGNGGFDITVGGNTHLEGGVIGSTADASKNRLDTGSLTVVDIENESRAKTSGGGIGTGMSSGGGISNPLGSAAGAGLSLLGGTKKNDSSTTRSDIAAGTVVVRDGNESALAGLDRTATGFDTDSALSAVDLRKMQERAEVMQLGGQLLFKGVGDLGGYLSQKAETEEGKAFWADGGNGRALLHGMAGAAMAALGGADALKGAVSAAGAEKAKIAISEFLENNKGSLSWEDYQSLMEVGSAMVGGALGGSTGANIAVTGDRFNRQLHPDEVKWINMNAAAFAAQEGISEAEAVRRLTTEGAALVDAKVARLVGIENVDLEATDFLSKMGGAYGFGATEAEYKNFNLYGNDLLNDDALYRQVIGSLLSSGVSKDDMQLKFYDLNNLRGTKIRGGDGWTMMGTFSGDIGAAGTVIASVAKGDGNGAAIGAASFLIPVRLPGAKIVGEVGAEIAGAATKQGVLKSEEILKSVQNAAAETTERAVKSSPSWKGSGPVDGVLALEPGSVSSTAIQNYFPGTRSKAIEFVFDPKTNKFAVGKPKANLGGSPHEQLGASIGGNPQELVGGMFSRGKNGEIITNEHSGHYWMNWSPEVRAQFEQAMKNYGIEIKHGAGM